jgi:hypothetical protein
MTENNDALADYKVTDADGVERQYQLTAKDAKERGGVAVNAPEKKARTPQDKAVTPKNKTKG